ncbi:ROK family protein [uncultured Bifidobacterium sp.]|uniref:ROK family protein n=1 Tax=uncultured Bifidobacterium sp. TaxID=165187 RepID=UPI00259AB517|nr:ROK family protein [uncultured Bifidobacterium sp.]
MADSTNPPPLLIGVDVGGTKIAGVVVETPPPGTDGEPRVLAEATRPARKGADALIDDVVALVGTLTDALPADAHVCAIGIGTPGTVDEATGNVRDIANLAIDQVPLASAVHARCGLPTSVENDVNAAAVGAARLVEDGDTADETIAFLNLGTGLAAGIIRDGVLDRGSSNTVGEIGHIPVEPHRWRCACGQHGCLETAGSGGAAKRLWPYADPPMPDILATAADATRTRHRQAVETRDTIIAAIADAIDVLAVTVDPEAIIIGGGMAKTGEPLLDAIRAELRRRAHASGFITSLQLPSRLRLAPTALPVGAIGAALAAAERTPSR